ncbi:pilus assembly protein CpaB [Paenibacillus sp. 1182]|uniref:Flp pilus assembly protein CpaB n=1 Tax=Paenibacillus sp. 1182 TaxID=2806565 RepID=UPI001AEB2A85|nr:Flp pilus assembly protein CpaB [Paenibacillus sp. 1182]MBP1308763.1 pilus assembly protein CpaB [Paenibacillus sp. 1182]
MKKKKILILALQLLLLIGTAVGFMAYTNGELQPVKVYVFNKDLKVNQQITAADVKEVSVPQSGVTQDFALDTKQFLNKYVGTEVYAGSFIYTKQIKDKGQLDPFMSMDLTKYRKISIPISYVEGFGGNVKRGDAVDLVFTGVGKKKDDKGTEQSFQYSKAFLQNVLIYNVTTSDGFEFKDHSTNDLTKTSGQSGEKIDTSANSDELAVVTLAVTLDQAEEITARMNAGNVRLVSRFSDNESYETLGFVLGDYSKVYSAPANAETGRGTINANQ